MKAGERLTPEQSARVVSISSFVAGGAIFLYLFDHLSFGLFDPGYKFMWRMWAASGIQTPVKPIQGHVLWGMWSLVWVVTGVLSIKRPGRRPWAAVSIAVLLAGVVLTGLIHQFCRR